MAVRPNPAERTAAESDYDKKFKRVEQKADDNVSEIKKQETTGGDVSWKTTAKQKVKESDKKGRFQFLGQRGGKLRKGSAFVFIIGLIGLGAWYTSIFAPNILLVNMKEMYTNDLSDSTIALDAYYKKLMNYKIGMADCGEKDSIKCKLTTMSRAQVKAFEKAGFTVLDNKVQEDNLDDDDPKNDKPESRYEVTAILPPAYKETIDQIKSTGVSWLTTAMSGNVSNLGNKISGDISSLSQQDLKKYTKDFLNYTPIATGDMLWLYAQMSDANKSLVYSVFNPKSSFFMDTRFKQRIKSKYGLTKAVTTTGDTEQAVNNSFDNSVRDTAGGVDALTGRPDPNNGVSLASLGNPSSAVNILTAFNALALNTGDSSYTDLECSWYSSALAVTNDAKQAKAATIARFAMQYLKAADAIKSGQAQEVATNTLSAKLAQSFGGSYGGQNATDSSMYQSIVHGELPLPSPYGLLYYLDTWDVIGALIPAWSQIIASSTALGGVTGNSGSLVEPPANLAGSARDYCLSGEQTENKVELKGQSTDDTRCPEAIGAMAFPGTQGLVSEAIEIARRTCPPPNGSDDFVKAILGDYRGPINNVILPSQKLVQATLTPYIAGLFAANTILWANAESLLFTSQTTGVPAGDALFAGTGEILGDMAMSRGMMPSNAAYMTLYLAKKDSVQKDYDDVAKYDARKNPLDPYNKFSVIGSLASALSPSYNSNTPLFSMLSTSMSLFKGSLKSLDNSANAIYYLQPDAFNPIRMTCPDPAYISIGITADTACNVRYSMSPMELAAQPDSVLDYMEKSHSDLTQDNVNELQERVAKADPLELSAANVTRQLTAARTAANQPMIDKKTGKAMPGSEYEKFLDYCVNRQDPWGASGVVVHRTDLPDDVKTYKKNDKNGDGDPVSTHDRGDPYQQVPGLPYPSITEGAKADQDWYTGKKCTDQSEELTNFRAYTMLCSVDGSLSGSLDCTDTDSAASASYSDPFYTSNDILYTSWN